MARVGIELLIVTDPSNMHWLTGCDGWSFYVHQRVLLPDDGPMRSDEYSHMARLMISFVA